MKPTFRLIVNNTKPPSKLKFIEKWAKSYRSELELTLLVIAPACLLLWALARMTMRH